MDNTLDTLSAAEVDEIEDDVDYGSLNETEEELAIINSRAAQIQKELRSEFKSPIQGFSGQKQTFESRRYKSDASLPSAMQQSVRMPNMESIQSDLNNLNQFLASKIEETTASSGMHTKLVKYSSLDKDFKVSAGQSSRSIQSLNAVDKDIQSSINRIKRNVHLTTDDEFSEAEVKSNISCTSIIDNSNAQATEWQNLNSNFLEARLSNAITPMLKNVKKETNELVEHMEHENFRRRVNLLKYELEAEQKSANSKITVLTEELKTTQHLLDVTSQKNFELNEEIKALNNRLEIEISKNFELNQVIKNKVGNLVKEVDAFKVFEKEVELKLKEKDKLIEDLESDNQEKDFEQENLKANYAKQLGSIKDDFENAIASYERKIKNQNEQHRVDRENVIKKLNKQNEMSMKEWRKKLADEKILAEEEIENLRLKIKEREQDHETEMRKQKTDFEEKLQAHVSQERSLAATEKEEAIRRQQMKYEDEISIVKKRTNDDLDNEKRRAMEAERLIDSLRQELSATKDDLASLQRESVEAIKETQKACEVTCEMKLGQLRDELNDEHARDIQNQRIECQTVVKDKQTADLDIERLTNKVSDLESSRMKEQKRVIAKLNKACAEVATCIGIQPRQVFLGYSGQGGNESTVNATRDDTAIGGQALNFDLLLKSALDNLSATTEEVKKYSRDYEKRLQTIREQFATYKTQRDIELGDMRFHLENETDRMIEFAKERLHQKYIRDLDEMKNEIKRDNDIESALRKTVDRQHTALTAMMKAKTNVDRVVAPTCDKDCSGTAEKNKRNIRRLQSLNSKVNYMRNVPIG